VRVAVQSFQQHHIIFSQ